MKDRGAIIILGHGTRRKQAGETFFSLVDKIACRLAHVRVVPACFSCDSPSLEEQARQLARDGYTRIIIFPYFLLSGKHIADELPCFVDALKAEFPAVSFELLATMEDEPLLEEIVVTRLFAYVLDNDDIVEPSGSVCEGSEERILGAPLLQIAHAAEHLPLLQAVARATGDLSLAQGLHIHEQALAAGRSALMTGGSVLYDSPMIAAGVPTLTTEMIPGQEAVDNDLHVTHDLPTALSFLKERMAGNIVAVGKHPEVLRMVMDLVAHGTPEPALVVGLPVGFAGASDAKKKLGRSGLVYISNNGPRGGISCVVAVLQALSMTGEIC